MEKETSEDWVVDITDMTCWNKSKNIVVAFENHKNIFIGKIKSIPLELVNKWTKDKQGDKNIKNVIKEAEESLMRSFLGW
jgi:hypothetical protein